MAKLPRMKAFHEIYRPSGQYRATGELDATGEPMTLALPEIITPGSFFTPADETEMRELIEAGACRPAERGEEARARAAEGESPDAEESSDVLAMATRPGPSPRDSVAEEHGDA